MTWKDDLIKELRLVTKHVLLDGWSCCGIPGPALRLEHESGITALAEPTPSSIVFTHETELTHQLSGFVQYRDRYFIAEFLMIVGNIMESERSGNFDKCHKYWPMSYNFEESQFIDIGDLGPRPLQSLMLRRLHRQLKAAIDESKIWSASFVELDNVSFVSLSFFGRNIYRIVANALGFSFCLKKWRYPDFDFWGGEYSSESVIYDDSPDDIEKLLWMICCRVC